ncbi:hypothetical protein TrRE_jg6796 [Triparma retinervis]|uniref:HpcH/HpaI aldolase/citrate lyase domain-containing protein n=1 Tax=Triparma retinervis TaxID=2557542 RepID=A0A9W7ASF7_9STRA|nr:hypothetical protein TrRE_jg6796 [Triparma retinervis]
MVSTGKDARAVVAAAKFPPLGTRGCAGGPWNDFGTGPDAFAVSKINEEVTVGVQIETLEGVENAREIASTPGVDWVFLGPVDLAVAMGKIETPEGWRHPEVRSVIADVGRIVREEGKSVGTLITGPEDLKEYDGFNVNVCLGSQLLKCGADSFLTSMERESL